MSRRSKQGGDPGNPALAHLSRKRNPIGDPPGRHDHFSRRRQELDPGSRPQPAPRGGDIKGAQGHLAFEKSHHHLASVDLKTIYVGRRPGGGGVDRHCAEPLPLRGIGRRFLCGNRQGNLGSHLACPTRCRQPVCGEVHRSSTCRRRFRGRALRLLSQRHQRQMCQWAAEHERTTGSPHQPHTPAGPGHQQPREHVPVVGERSSQLHLRCIRCLREPAAGSHGERRRLHAQPVDRQLTGGSLAGDECVAAGHLHQQPGPRFGPHLSGWCAHNSACPGELRGGESELVAGGIEEHIQTGGRLLHLHSPPHPTADGPPHSLLRRDAPLFEAPHIGLPLGLAPTTGQSLPQRAAIDSLDRLQGKPTGAQRGRGGEHLP